MRHDEFIGQVQQRAHLASPAEAERVSRATLETLGERIPECLAGNLGDLLPQEIGEHLRHTDMYFGVGERFNLHTFTDRIAKRAGVDEPRATYLARVVFEVVAEATQGKELDKVRASVPRDIRLLIDAGGSGSISR